MRESLELFQLLRHGKGDPGAVAQMRNTCNVHYLRQLADVEQLFLRLDIEFAEFDPALEQFPVGDCLIEASLPRRLLRRNIQAGALAERDLGPVADRRRQGRRIKIVEIAQRSLAAWQTANVAH